MKKLLCTILSLVLGLFLVDGVVSLVDDTLILFFGLRLLSVIRALVFFFAVLTAILTYGLMGLTPMIPKRPFLLVALFNPVAALGAVPFAIYCYGQMQRVSWVISLCEVALGLGILHCLLGGFKWRWSAVAEEQLGTRRFSWLNLSAFLLVNVLGLLPAVPLYLALCASLAVNHFTESFLTLRPGGLTVQVRKYVRNDGKTIQLIPMAHVGEAEFYRKVSQSFPSNSIILMEGVTDQKNLLTNGISYKRMAHSLGLAEQAEEFRPAQGEMVQADVDVEQFSTNTIGLLNLAMLFHAKGLRVENVFLLLQYSPPPHFEDQLFDDLLRKRNRHLLEELHARLPQSENIIVPWGVAHMPGIAKDLQKSGFRLGESQDYTVINFRSAGTKRAKGKS